MFKIFLVVSFGIFYGVQGHPGEKILRIAGGSDARPGTAPFHVTVLFRDSHICSGSIISKRTILTSEQCVDVKNPSAFSILVNTTKLSEPGQLYRVRQITTHPEDADDRKSTNTIHDIALLYLEDEIVFSKAVQKIEIDCQDVGGGLKTTAHGWGLTNIANENPDNLQVIDLTTIDLEECRRSWEGITNIQSDEICTFVDNGGGMCYGDAGGALVYNEKAIGLSSWGYSCAFGKPDVFLHLGHHAKWISDNLI